MPSYCIFSTVADLASEVIVKLENRTTDVSRAWQWLAESLVELTSSTELRGEFDNFESSGPLFALSTGAREYPFSSLINTNDYNDGTLDIRIWTNPPLNSNYLRLNYTSYQLVDTYGNTKGRPTAWYRFNDLVGFDLIPDNAYQVQMRYQKQYPILCPIQNTLLLLPNDWQDVVVLCAVYRGFIELNQYEKANATHQILHGDPKKPGDLGLISKRRKRFEREAWRKEAGLRPRVGRYSARTR